MFVLSNAKGFINQLVVYIAIGFIDDGSNVNVILFGNGGNKVHG